MFCSLSTWSCCQPNKPKGQGSEQLIDLNKATDGSNPGAQKRCCSKDLVFIIATFVGALFAVAGAVALLGLCLQSAGAATGVLNAIGEGVKVAASTLGTEALPLAITVTSAGGAVIVAAVVGLIVTRFCKKPEVKPTVDLLQEKEDKPHSKPNGKLEDVD